MKISNPWVDDRDVVEISRAVVPGFEARVGESQQRIPQRCGGKFQALSGMASHQEGPHEQRSFYSPYDNMGVPAGAGIHVTWQLVVVLLSLVGLGENIGVEDDGGVDDGGGLFLRVARVVEFPVVAVVAVPEQSLGLQGHYLVADPNL